MVPKLVGPTRMCSHTPAAMAHNAKQRIRETIGSGNSESERANTWENATENVVENVVENAVDNVHG